MTDTITYDRYFLSYSGLSLPLKLVGELDPAEIDNRNTFFGACEDKQGRQILVHKVVYGEVELEHRYGYHDCGALSWVDIRDEAGDTQRLNFAADGSKL